MTMRTEALTVLVVLSVAAAIAGDDPARLIHGKWKLDVKLSAETQNGYEGATPAQRESLARKIETAVPDATFEFAPGTYAFGWTGKPVEKGTYEVNGSAPERVVLGVLPQDAAPGDVDAVDQMDIQLHGRDVISLVHNDIPYTLSLRRVK
jgi:hypothetical protein